jgi:hypothetical protein
MKNILICLRLSMLVLFLFPMNSFARTQKATVSPTIAEPQAYDPKIKTIWQLVQSYDDFVDLGVDNSISLLQRFIGENTAGLLTEGRLSELKSPTKMLTLIKMSAIVCQAYEKQVKLAAASRVTKEAALLNATQVVPTIYESILRRSPTPEELANGESLVVISAPPLPAPSPSRQQSMPSAVVAQPQPEVAAVAPQDLYNVVPLLLCVKVLSSAEYLNQE